MSLFHEEPRKEDIMNKTEETAEHFDGVGIKELYPEERNENWDHNRAVRNVPTRLYLQQVREISRAIELLERRMNYRSEAGLDSADLLIEIEDKRRELKRITVDMADEISKLGNVSQEMVLFKRYIDMMTWDEIAESMDLRVKTVLKFHGHGLAHMKDVLLADGLIEEEGQSDEDN